MIYTQVSVFVVLSLSSTPEGAAFQTRELWIIAITISSFWVAVVMALLLFSEKGLAHTFYQPIRAWEYNKALFDTGIDEYRM